MSQAKINVFKIRKLKKININLNLNKMKNSILFFFGKSHPNLKNNNHDFLLQDHSLIPLKLPTMHRFYVCEWNPPVYLIWHLSWDPMPSNRKIRKIKPSNQKIWERGVHQFFNRLSKLLNITFIWKLIRKMTYIK